MKKGIVYSLLSGIVTAAAFFTPQVGFLCFFALIPIFRLLLADTLGKKQAFIYCLLFALSFYSVSVLWLYGLFPVTNFDVSLGAGFALVTAGWILITLLMSAELAVALYILWRMNLPKHIFPVAAGCMFIILEFFQGIGGLGFTWGRIGLSQAGYPIIIQSAAVLGPMFISFVVVAVAGYMALYIKTKNIKYICVATVIFCINIGIGFCIPDYSGREVSVSMVWEDVSNEEKMHRNIGNVLLNLEDKSIESADEDTDFILWTETAVPADHYKYPFLHKTYSNIAKKTEAVLISAGFDREDGKKYSAMFFTNPDGKYAGSVYKRQLVPFGEYTPFRSVLDKIAPSLTASMRDAEEELNFSKGKSTVITQKGVAGGLVCYDSAMQYLPRQTVNEGAEILMLSVNDSWFEGTSMTWRHMSQAIFRAVENGRYVVRSTNRGISGVIAPDGKIICSASEGEYLKGKAQMINKKTPYTVLGDIIVYIAAAVLLAVYVWEKIKCRIF